MHTLLQLDQSVLRFFNGSDSLFLDGVVVVLTSGWAWIPLFLALLYLVVKNNDTMGQILLTVACALLCVVLADGLSDGLVKPLVARPRPLNDPVYKDLFDTVAGMGSKQYSFFSAHAANTFSLALFFSLIIRDRAATVALVAWSLLNCWTRLYLAMHYPSDILVGLLWGALVGWGVWVLYRHLYLRFSPRMNFISTHYTPTGYAKADVDTMICMMVLTLVYAILHSVASL